MCANLRQEADRIAHEIYTEGVHNYIQPPSGFYVGGQLFVLQSQEQIFTTCLLYAALVRRAGVTEIDPEIVSIKVGNHGNAHVRITSRYFDPSHSLLGLSVVDYVVEIGDDCYPSVRSVSFEQWPFETDRCLSDYVAKLGNLTAPRNPIH